MSTSLQELTVCIFSKNRHSQLNTKILFWEKLNVQLIILDASDKPLDRLFGATTVYVSVPEMSLDHRLLIFSSLVNSKYLLLSPDDDYFLPSGLKHAVKFLDNNSDYTSVQGLRIRLIDNPKFRWIPDYTSQLNLHFCETDPLERLLRMSNSMHYIYSVMRSDIFKIIVSSLEDTQGSPRNSGMKYELMFNYLLPIFGKHSILPFLYSARTNHINEGSDINFGLWINDPEDNTAKHFKENIWCIYSTHLNLSPELAKVYEERLTENFSRMKMSEILPKRNLPVISLRIKKMIDTSFLRFFYPLSKFSYLKFFKVIIASKYFFSSIKDFLFLLNFRHLVIKSKTKNFGNLITKF